MGYDGNALNSKDFGGFCTGLVVFFAAFPLPLHCHSKTNPIPKTVMVLGNRPSNNVSLF